VEAVAAGWDLGRGESELLSFALTHAGFEVVLDGLASSRCAAALSIPVRGTFGGLLLAHKQGLLRDLDSVLDQVQGAGMHIRQDVLATLRRLA
jgi:predicted nucleic acid-binding protein